MSAKRFPLDLPAGMVAAGTTLQSEGRWYDGQLIRFLGKDKMPVGGWRRMVDNDGVAIAPLDEDVLGLSGVVRGLTAWRRAGGGITIAFGTVRPGGTQGLYVVRGGELFNITPSDEGDAPTGGTINTTLGNGPSPEGDGISMQEVDGFRYYTLESGTVRLNRNVVGTLLLVGGGGIGGVAVLPDASGYFFAGGGGGGEVVVLEDISIPAGEYEVRVGSINQGVPIDAESSFGDHVAKGGGVGGGFYDTADLEDATDGGSGGGGGAWYVGGTPGAGGVLQELGLAGVSIAVEGDGNDGEPFNPAGAGTPAGGGGAGGTPPGTGAGGTGVIPVAFADIELRASPFLGTEGLGSGGHGVGFPGIVSTWPGAGGFGRTTGSDYAQRGIVVLKVAVGS